MSNTDPPPLRTPTTGVEPIVALFAAIDDAETAIEANRAARDAFTRSADSTELDAEAKQAALDTVKESLQRRRVAVSHAEATYTLVAERIEAQDLADATQRLRAIPGIDLAIFADDATGEAFDDLEGGWPIASAAEIDAVLSGEWETPKPEILHRSDASALLYRGKVHSLAGEPGGGKTWVALFACVEVLSGGGAAMLIDHEDRLDTAVRRVVALGAQPDDVKARFRYVAPTYAITGGLLPNNVLRAAEGAEVIIIDSAGEALAFNGLSQNDDGEVRNWFEATPRRLADGGAAVLILDHVTKDAEGRGRWAIGSQRKLAAIDGMAMTMTTLVAASKVAAGRYLVKCAKDRGGNYTHGATVADITISPVGDDVHIAIDAPNEAVDEDGNKLHEDLFGPICELLGDGDSRSRGAIEASVKGKGTRVRAALDQLEQLGHVRVARQGSAHIYSLVTPYERRSEVDEMLGSATISSPRPSSSLGQGRGDRNHLVPSSPPEGDEGRGTVVAGRSKNGDFDGPRPSSHDPDAATREAELKAAFEAGVF